MDTVKSPIIGEGMASYPFRNRGAAEPIVPVDPNWPGQFTLPAAINVRYRWTEHGVLISGAWTLTLQPPQWPPGPQLWYWNWQPIPYNMFLNGDTGTWELGLAFGGMAHQRVEWRASFGLRPDGQVYDPVLPPQDPNRVPVWAVIDFAVP